MCAPGCHDVVWRLSRRGFFRTAATAGAATALPGAPTALPGAPTALPGAAMPATAAARPDGFGRVVDLTHALSPDFPTFTGEPYLGIRRAKTLDRDGYNVLQWTLFEHVATHLDAPIHFANGAPSADMLAAEALVVPLAVIDVRAQAEADPNYRVLPADLHAWEGANGPLPEDACV